MTWQWCIAAPVSAAARSDLVRTVDRRGRVGLDDLAHVGEGRRSGRRREPGDVQVLRRVRARARSPSGRRCRALRPRARARAARSQAASSDGRGRALPRRGRRAVVERRVAGRPPAPRRDAPRRGHRPRRRRSRSAAPARRPRRRRTPARSASARPRGRGRGDAVEAPGAAAPRWSARGCAGRRSRARPRGRSRRRRSRPSVARATAATATTVPPSDGHVGHLLGPGARVDHAPAAENQHPPSNTGAARAAHWTIGQAARPLHLCDRTNTLRRATRLRFGHVNAGDPPGHRRAAGRRHWLAENFARLVDEHDVPGRRSPCWRRARSPPPPAASRASPRRCAVDTDTVFQIGSITKIWTTTLVMQLVDDGLLDLDEPLLDYLPELVIGDMEAAKALTTRHLLTHTAGFEGDIFTDTGRGEDAIEKYVATLTDLPAALRAGRDLLLQQHRLRRARSPRRGPAGQAVRRGAPRADREAPRSPARQPEPVRGDPAPGGHRPRRRRGRRAGAGDLLGAGALERAGGVDAGDDAPPTCSASCGCTSTAASRTDGTRVLSAASVQAMQTREVDLPRLAGMGDAWGLGWELFDTPQGTVVAHDGGTIGQAAFLRVVPDAGVAIAMLTNGGDFFGLFNDVVATLLTRLTGIELPARPTPPADPRAGGRQPLPGSLRRHHLRHHRQPGRRTARSGSTAGPRTSTRRSARSRSASSSSISPTTASSPSRPYHGIHVVFAFIGSVTSSSGVDQAKYVHYGRVVARVE